MRNRRVSVAARASTDVRVGTPRSLGTHPTPRVDEGKLCPGERFRRTSRRNPVEKTFGDATRTRASMDSTRECAIQALRYASAHPHADLFWPGMNASRPPTPPPPTAVRLMVVPFFFPFLEPPAFAFGRGSARAARRSTRGPARLRPGRAVAHVAPRVRRRVMKRTRGTIPLGVVGRRAEAASPPRVSREDAPPLGPPPLRPFPRDSTRSAAATARSNAARFSPSGMRAASSATLSTSTPMAVIFPSARARRCARL